MNENILNNQNEYEKWVIKSYHRGCQSLVNLWKTHNRLIARCLLLQMLSLDDQNLTTINIQSERTHKASSRVSGIWKMSFTMNSRLNIIDENWNFETAQAWCLGNARRDAWLGRSWGFCLSLPGVAPGLLTCAPSSWNVKVSCTSTRNSFLGLANVPALVGTPVGNRGQPFCTKMSTFTPKCGHQPEFT